ncbi:penicillin-binding protein 1B [Arenicella xantha]|uniref:Penicillin-binding protein 1B n=1 Tax=Arenicella xantha TaxID=644221 RepID=A0A395JPZ8_9GAMM|nr:penicillin-binding protein 1B [Arenicella xantha]RBP53413.1 penicillin-binding protein 1B [Arenicella xantha]
MPRKKATSNKRVAPVVRKKRSSGGSSSSRKKRASRANAKSSKPQSTSSKVWSFIRFWLLRGFLLGLLFLLGFTVYLDISIRKKFEGQKWALPAHVYTRPMELYIGQAFDEKLVLAELAELGYTSRNDLARVGTYRYTGDELSIYQREFRFWDGLRPQQIARMSISGQRIQSITVEVPDVSLPRSDTEIVRLEPRLFGSVSPLSHEDRSLLRIEQVPSELIDGLIANEDRQFRSHFGVNPLGIARAMIRNVRAGRVVQGGSTLTQQLVKNYYLSSEQSYKRKAIEAIMAVLLEMHYSKDEIMQAYLNEVHLSQVGNRAIHGFGLASRYFFGRPIEELELDQIAVLIAVNNGPSKYNPIRNPNNALERRNLVLKTMLEQGVIDDVRYQQAVAAKLSVSPTAEHAALLSYPSFMGFVRENLRQDYQQEDLLNDGLQIHTTLNPRIQESLETAVRKELAAVEKNKGIKAGSLQVAAVVLRTDNGEVAAMLGDRNPSFSGYNRALSAKRPVGSLLKPFVYLTALEQPERYSLASLISDRSITVSQRGSPDWTPGNYDKREHGDVMLIEALSRSYNLATVQLGMELGVPEVANTIRRLGYQDSVSELPSVLLGAVPMTVMDVGQLYLSLASGGFKTPVKGIRSVLSNENEPLARYSLDIEQVVEPEFAMLINYALQDVVRNGTARNVLTGFRYDYGLAGKTGTTDDYRDSWFAGFSGNYVMVVWVGRDDYQSTGLTGASGAAKLWAKSMQAMPLERFELGYSDAVISQTIHYSLDPQRQDCSLERNLPMLIESLELENLPCAKRMQYDLIDEDELQHFEPSPDQAPLRRKKKSWWQRLFD